MVRAYILVQTSVGEAENVARALRGVDGVLRAVGVTGPYDVIVLAEAADVPALGRLVVSDVQGAPGITRTVTCPVVSEG